jgi:hypothetical protein
MPDFEPLNADASTFYGSGLPDFQNNQIDDRYSFTGSNTNQNGMGVGTSLPAPRTKVLTSHL